jgi:hypothetical protein
MWRWRLDAHFLHTHGVHDARWVCGGLEEGER